MNYLALNCPHDHQLHTEVEVLNRHVVDLPERVAGLPKELESRESPIPYDYDLSVKDPQDRVIHNNIVELDVKVLAAVQSPPIAFLQRGTLERIPQQDGSSSSQTNNSNADKTGWKGTAACCGDQLRLNPPSLLAPNKPFVGAGGDTVSVGEVNIAIPGEKSHPEQPQRLHRRQQQQQQR